MRELLIRARPGLAIERASPEPSAVSRSCSLCPAAFTRRAPPTPTPSGMTPGGALIVADGVDGLWGDHEGRFARQAIEREARGLPLAFDVAVRCAVESGAADAAATCAPHLAWAAKVGRPSRVLAIGDMAAGSVIGPSSPADESWRGYALGEATVAFLIPSPWRSDRRGNRFARQDFEAAVRWALTVPLDELRARDPSAATARIIESPADAELACEEARASPRWGLDVEAAGLLYSPEYRLFTVAITPASRRPLVWNAAALSDERLIAPLRRLARDSALGRAPPVIAHNAGYDLAAMRTAFGWAPRLSSDGSALRRLRDSEALGRLKNAAWTVGLGGGKDEAAEALEAEKKWCRSRKPSDREILRRYGARAAPFGVLVRDSDGDLNTYAYALLPDELRSRYCAGDSLAAVLVAEAEEKALGPDGLWIFHEILRPAIASLEQVSAWGVPMDRDSLGAFEKLVVSRREDLDAELARIAPINWGSSAQVAKVLWDDLKVKRPRRAKRGKERSVDADALKGVEHPAVATYREWKAIAKREGYAAILDHVRPSGLVHATFDPNGARTGRLSCKEPPFHQIPKADPKTSSGRAGLMLRSSVAARPGRSLLACDYSQVELRKMAEECGDPGMIQVFRDGIDYHLRTAQLISKTAWGIEPHEVTAVHRSKAKGVNFGLAFGMGDAALGVEIGGTAEDAARIRAGIYGAFPTYARWCQERIAEARQTGGVWTRWRGRRARWRKLYNIASADGGERSNAENGAINTPIQGGANDHCVAALIALVDWIVQDQVPARLILSIHDELLFEVRDDTLAELYERVVEEMRRYEDSVPLVVEAKAGKTWGSLTSYPPREGNA